MIKLFEHQEKAVDQLKTGSILCGGVGSGKSLTAIMYYYVKECGGKVDKTGTGEWTAMTNPKDLFIITTAAKRDTLDWERECSRFMLSKDRDASVNGVLVTVDSWNNIKKYTKIKNAFFIFDEQRVVGSGAWVRSFLKITKNNNWILLSATPGDTWSDYIPVFVANGFYKNRTAFLREHAVYNRFTKYPKVDRYIGTGKLLKLKRQIMVSMTYHKLTVAHPKVITVSFDEKLYEKVAKERWNPFTNLPIKDIGDFCYNLRKVVNSHPSRLTVIRELIEKHRKVIIFYNFNYELEILRQLKDDLNIAVTEYNGHKHEPLPKGECWAYLVQYASGAEGWNCVETNTVIFYSQNYSYRAMIQAAGRIDRLNTPFADLYYYTLQSRSVIDLAIAKALKDKKIFNESNFVRF